MGNLGLGSNLDTGGGEPTSHALQDLVDDQLGGRSSSTTGVQHHADTSETNQQSGEHDPLKKTIASTVSAGQSLSCSQIATIATYLDFPGVRHDSTGHDTKDGQSDGLSRSEVRHVSNVPVLGDKDKVVEVGVLQVEGNEVGETYAMFQCACK